MATAKKSNPAQAAYIRAITAQIKSNTRAIEEIQTESQAPSFVRKSMARPPTQFSNMIATAVAVGTILVLN